MQARKIQYWRHYAVLCQDYKVPLRLETVCRIKVLNRRLWEATAQSCEDKAQATMEALRSWVCQNSEESAESCRPRAELPQESLSVLQVALLQGWAHQSLWSQMNTPKLCFFPVSLWTSFYNCSLGGCVIARRQWKTGLLVHYNVESLSLRHVEAQTCMKGAVMSVLCHKSWMGIFVSFQSIRIIA